MKRVLSYPVIVATAIFILVVISYSNHFNNGFHFDDMHTIVNNVHIRNLKNIPAFYSDPKMFSASPAHWGMRPLVTTTLAIDYFLGNGLKPFFFQLSTFIWHLLLVILLSETY
jgi:protein O-mannosyl-transferase